MLEHRAEARQRAVGTDAIAGAHDGAGEAASPRRCAASQAELKETFFHSSRSSRKRAPLANGIVRRGARIRAASTNRVAALGGLGQQPLLLLAVELEADGKNDAGE